MAMIAARKAWLNERNRCTSAQCLIDSDGKRITALCSQLDAPSATPGQHWTPGPLP
ncbi:hypothetical protein [Burkholderia ubonensis]|uniref:hypothetical protein n=1 Tax=Burkholderia ubonensis TaxID=101571 RepID=UPI0012FE763C|nr:hypothetical protein [Burkholderia ubonensis]